MAKILIVDDSLTITKSLQVLLEQKGHEVYVADDGIKGLDLAKKQMPDLMLLDIMLPKLNGYEVCNILKMDSNYSTIKIILFTAKMTSEAKELSEETGANGYMTKDSDPDKILEKIEELLVT